MTGMDVRRKKAALSVGKRPPVTNERPPPGNPAGLCRKHQLKSDNECQIK